ncbi:MAG: 4a-hydroxytetrahydrobiopterin dehydratase [Thermodesulfobacteriota bacterium]
MEDLAGQQCEACRIGAPLVTPEQMKELQPKVPDWEVVEVDGIQRLTRRFSFKDFVEAIDFTNRVGAIAEEEGHHPAILTEYGSVTVTWWSHKIKGLHVNDFIMAARTDRLC